MTIVLPFQGYRYNKEIVGDFSKVVTQPYDKISAEAQREYYHRSPFNAARITKNLEKNEAPETDYPNAGETLALWIKDSVLVQDALPSIYAYYQDYEIEDESRQQRGFI